MRVGQTRRRYSNEAGIIAALRSAGATVVPISGKGAPDILVRFRGCTFAFELKTQRGTRTVAQQLTGWPIVRSVDEALMAITRPCSTNRHRRLLWDFMCDQARSANRGICNYKRGDILRSEQGVPDYWTDIAGFRGASKCRYLAD